MDTVVASASSDIDKLSDRGNMPPQTDKDKSGSFLKYFSLILLTGQNAVFILSMRYVRTRGGDMFMSTTAVILQEGIKCIASMAIILVQEGGVRPWLRHLYDNIIQDPVDCLKISVPSLVYTLQNNLIFIAVSNLDAATFQVTYQLKILTTAMLSVLMLNKQLSKVQWTALVLLFAGVSIVQMQPENLAASKTVATVQHPLTGLIAVVVACCLSGFAGVYFEKILKGTKQSVWLRNTQLGGIGVVVGFVTMELKDGTSVAEKGFFFGYTPMVWVVILLQSCGGLIVAVVVKYADNILKGFATSGAIILSCMASVFLFHFTLSLEFCIGSTLVIIATYMYSKFVPTEKSISPAISKTSNV